MSEVNSNVKSEGFDLMKLMTGKTKDPDSKVDMNVIVFNILVLTIGLGIGFLSLYIAQNAIYKKTKKTPFLKLEVND